MEFLWILLAGLAAGFINVIAGGGSMLTLPLLIFAGLEQGVANGTNRVAIFAQNLSAFKGFSSKGFKINKEIFYLAGIATIGALLGSYLAANFAKGAVFNKILACLLVAFIVYSFFQPKYKDSNVIQLNPNKLFLNLGLFFLIGIYGGFIQAGVGLIIMAALSLVNHLNIHQINFMKVVIVGTYTIIALTTFILHDQVSWIHGLVLAAGNSIGGWLAGKYSSNIPTHYVKRTVIFITILLAIKLWLD